MGAGADDRLNGYDQPQDQPLEFPRYLVFRPSGPEYLSKSETIDAVSRGEYLVSGLVVLANMKTRQVTLEEQKEFHSARFANRAA